MVTQVSQHPNNVAQRVGANGIAGKPRRHDRLENFSKCCKVLRTYVRRAWHLAMDDTHFAQARELLRGQVGMGGAYQGMRQTQQRNGHGRSLRNAMVAARHRKLCCMTVAMDSGIGRIGIVKYPTSEKIATNTCAKRLGSKIRRKQDTEGLYQQKPPSPAA